MPFSCKPSLCPRTCSPTQRATGTSAVAMGLGRCTTWSWRSSREWAWPVGTTHAAGVTATPGASCAGVRTSTSSSALWATPTSRRRRGTCTFRTPTFLKPSTGRSRKAEAAQIAIPRARASEIVSSNSGPANRRSGIPRTHPVSALLARSPFPTQDVLVRYLEGVQSRRARRLLPATVIAYVGIYLPDAGA